MKRNNGVDDLIYSPSDGVSYAVKYLENARKNLAAGYGLRFPIDEIARNYPVPPLMPGKVMTVQAKSHHGKSAYMNFWQNDLAERLADNHRREDIIIAVLAENMVEEALIGEMLRQAERMGKRGELSSMDTVRLVASEIQTTPIYYIGESIARSDDGMPRPTMTNIGRAIGRIIEQRKDKGLKTHIQGVFVDYIQAMPLDNEVLGAMPDKTRRLQVRSDFFGLRRLAVKYKTPCVLASQSKQDFPAPREMQVPTLYSHQETSAIPQHTDADIGLWMPKNDLPYNELITFKKISYRVTENIAWMRINKQRGFDPETLKLLPAATEYHPLIMDFNTGTYSPANLEEVNLN